MKFILDANIPYSTKQIFPKSDKVFHVRDIGLAEANDYEIIKRALKEGAVLVTRDLDFANIILYPVDTHCGVIAIRVPSYFTAPEINKVLKSFFATVDKKTLAGALTIVEPGQYRIRK